MIEYIIIGILGVLLILTFVALYRCCERIRDLEEKHGKAERWMTAVVRILNNEGSIEMGTNTAQSLIDRYHRWIND